MEYNLFLDDFRTPETAFTLCVREPRYLKEKWVIVKDYDEFVSALLRLGMPKLISFDHDLADEHYHIGSEEEYLGFDYTKCTEKTGLHCAKYLVEMHMDFGVISFPETIVHSANPAGRDNILAYLRNYKKTLPQEP